jgi:hypothetical protein
MIKDIQEANLIIAVMYDGQIKILKDRETGMTVPVSLEDAEKMLVDAAQKYKR